MNYMSKGASELITSALYVGITITAISAAITVGLPALENLQDSAAISNAESFMEELDNNIEEVVSEGEGSVRTVEANIDRGQLFFEDERQALIYELETEADVISPQTSIRDGNIILSSNADVQVNEAEFEGTECYMMENEHLRVCIKDIPEEDPEELDVSDLIVLYELKEEDSRLDGEISVELNENPDTSTGEIYTDAETGDFIGTGEVIANIDNTEDPGFTYNVYYRLPTGSDFLQIDVQNFR